MDTNIANIVKALAYNENGGKPSLSKTKSGPTGEMKSLFQYTPDTWKIYSKQASGQDNLPLTPENESQVTYQKVGQWTKDGYTPEQIFSMWNAGEQRPDAYKQNFRGVNKKYGVAYDTPAYVKNAMAHLKQFESEGQNPSTQEAVVSSMNTGLVPTQKPKPTPAPQAGLMTPQMKQARQV